MPGPQRAITAKVPLVNNLLSQVATGGTVGEEDSSC